MITQLHTISTVASGSYELGWEH